MADGAMTCPACGKAVSQAPEERPAAGPAEIPTEIVGSYRLARLGDRLLAIILDTLLLGAVFAVIGMWSAVRWGGVTSNGFSIEGKAALITFSLVGVAAFLYYWILEGVVGATLGKAIIGVQVRSKDGGRCKITAALLRTLLRIVDGIALYLVGFLIAVFSKLRQRLGDHIAHTVVVERPIGSLGRAVLVALWLAGIGAGISGAYVLHRGAPVSAASVAPSPSSSSSSKQVSSVATGSSQPLVLTSGDFKLVNFAWTEGKDGPPRAQGPYKPRDDVYVKFDLIGFTTDAQGQINVTTSMTAYDPNGLALDKTWSDTARGTLATGGSMPINYHFHFNLPPYVPGGTYKLVIKAHDAVKNSDGEFSPSFSVEAAPPIPPGSRLEIRNFWFSTSEDGPSLSPAVYQPGQTIHYSYDLFGAQFRDNRANFHTAFKLVGPDGRTLLDRPDWDTTDQILVYHPANFFVHFHGYVTLPSESAKGTYTEQFVVTDRQANMILTYEGKFELR